jgi:hypothetical protein
MFFSVENSYWDIVEAKIPIFFQSAASRRAFFLYPYGKYTGEETAAGPHPISARQVRRMRRRSRRSCHFGRRGEAEGVKKEVFMVKEIRGEGYARVNSMGEPPGGDNSFSWMTRGPYERRRE